MSKNLALLEQEKIIAIIRGISYESIEDTAKALMEGGIVFLEVTLNTPRALEMISECKGKFGDKLCIGAGTVLDIQMAKAAIHAGAKYLVSPNLDEEVIKYGVSQGVDVWPGTLTPTEIVKAYKAGASVVKVFPIGGLGVSYLKDIRGPINHIPMMVTGGITLDNIHEFLNVGAVAVGIGGNLVNKKLIQEKNFREITKLAQQFVGKVKENHNK
jgi:2-dehydro-3-deoxyphosphogluconate aldolase/(4S)-4-hydroxy-2-oxoglutarate aldolase